MAIQLSDHFTYGRLLRFTLPSIMMMIFTSLYSIVDGFFVSNYVGKTPFAALNLIMPVIMILGSIGLMFGTGGSALVAKTMGEGDLKKAQRLFSLIVYMTILSGILLTLLGLALIRPIAALLGAEGELLENSVLYGRILLLALPFYMLQFEFQSFFITAQKPQLGLAVTVISGVANMVLDALFIAAFSWGLAGAAAATAVSEIVGGVIPIVYFSRKNGSLLRLGKTGMDGRTLWRTCTNGSSELMSNISISLVSMLYNIQLMKYAGENGVVAYGVLMYVSMVFTSAFLGYATGTAPVVGYHYGAGNHAELKNLLKRSAVVIGVFSICMFLFAEGSAEGLSRIFVGYDAELMALTVRAFRLYSFSSLFGGISIYGSSFFTALNDGLTSALISFMRCLVFQAAAVLILPVFFKIDGIWASIVVAEGISAAMTVWFLVSKRKKYRYW